MHFFLRVDSTAPDGTVLVVIYGRKGKNTIDRNVSVKHGYVLPDSMQGALIIVTIRGQPGVPPLRLRADTESGQHPANWTSITDFQPVIHEAVLKHRT